MFVQDIILEGKRVVLFPYQAQYSEEYFEISHNRKDLKKITNVEPLLSLQDFQSLQEEWKQEQYQQCLLIQKKSNHKIIGDVNLVHNPQMGEKEIEVHMFLAHRQDKEDGIGGEALKLVEQYIKEHLAVNKIMTRVASETQLRKSQEIFDFQKKSQEEEGQGVPLKEGLEQYVD